MAGEKVNSESVGGGQNRRDARVNSSVTDLKRPHHVENRACFGAAVSMPIKLLRGFVAYNKLRGVTLRIAVY
jgi:hypothetical protein